jgi:hypothetical protein
VTVSRCGQYLTTTMDAFITTITDQTRSLIAVSAGRYVNTGDRMMDTALNVVVGTLLSASLTLLIHLTYKGGWRALLHYLPWRRSDQQYELDFDPSMARTAKNSELGYYFSNPHGKRSFVRWFNHYLGSKQFKNATPLGIMPDVSAAKPDSRERFAREYLDRCVSANSYGNSDSLLPIWRDRCGEFVYMFSDRYSNSVAYYSNNPSALRRALVHIDSYNNSLVDKKAEVTQQTLETLVIERGGNSIEWEELGYVDIRATFDTLFFPQKAAYMDMLTRFKEKRMYPAHLPIENKLGIVLHGPPGTGKTRLIASTANFLGYNVNMVDMSKVRTKKAFSNIMSDLHGKKIIIVLEEFDCVSGILRRDMAQEQPVHAQPAVTAPAPTSTATGLTPEAMALMMLASKGDSKGDDSWQKTLREERDAATDQLDLAYLLTKLDGLESNEGRIIIATTNHPERIDPALLRPGRLGLKVCLSYATREVARDILCMVFQITAEKERTSVLKQLHAMDEGSWTPAEILQEAIMRNSMSAMVEFLTAATP